MLRGAGTFGASVAIELALQSLIDMGMDGINKYRLKNKIENLLKKSPEDLKEYVSKLIKKTEKELKYQKGPLALFDKITAMGGDTVSDIKLRELVLLLYMDLQQQVLSLRILIFQTSFFKRKDLLMSLV